MREMKRHSIGENGVEISEIARLALSSEVLDRIEELVPLGPTQPVQA